MKVTILGSASGVPVKDRKSSAVLVERGSDALLFDAGESVTATLQALGKDIDAIKRIYLSHTHPDHVSGLPMLLQSMHLGGRKAPLCIVSDQRTHAWLQEVLRGMFLVTSEWDFSVHIVNLSYDEFRDEIGVEVSAFENSHLEAVKAKGRDYGVPAACYSFIVRSEGRSLLLSSDIGGIDDIAGQLPNMDAAVVECTHISFDDLLEAMARTAETRFVLNHIPPELDAELPRLKNILQSKLGSRAVFADDGYSLTIPEAMRNG